MKALATFLFALIFLTLYPPSPAVAGGNGYPAKEPDIPDAQELIDACWAISKERRETGTTGELRGAALDTALCLEEEIHKNASILISESSFPSKHISKTLEEIRSSYGKFYWHMYNSVEACYVSCGTIFYSFHNSALAKLYEDILKDIIEQRRKYGPFG